MKGFGNKGPWTLEEDTDWPFGFSVRSGKDLVISSDRIAYSTAQQNLADIYDATGFKQDERGEVIKAVRDQKADMELIAAAPELLDALINMLIKDEIHQQKFMAGIVSNITRNKYKSIIEKAKGISWENLKEQRNGQPS